MGRSKVDTLWMEILLATFLPIQLISSGDAVRNTHLCRTAFDDISRPFGQSVERLCVHP